MADRESNGATGGLGRLIEELPTDRLREEAQNMMSALGQRAVSLGTEKVDMLTDRLTDFADRLDIPDSPGLKAALSGGKALGEGKSPLRAAVSAGMSGVKAKAKSVFSGAGREDRGGGGGGKRGQKLKVTNIVEDIDIGLPLRDVYNQWTEFGSFPNFMKKVENVEHESDEKSNWKAQVFWSHRTWQATITEQMPDELIVWRSKGEKGHVDGAVTFHEITPDLTRVLVVLEYNPQGFFEKTGNLWRAQGRRVRLELKHFRRHAMTRTLLDPEEVEGWRGEIHDGEVVKTHEDALAEEQEQGEQEGPEDEYEGEAPEEELESEEARGEEAEAEEEEEGEEEAGEAAEAEEPEEEEPEGEEAQGEEAQGEEEPHRGRRVRRRSPAWAGGG